MIEERELTCQELVELVTDYLEDRMPPSERARFEEHLGACPACVTCLEQFRLTVRAVAGGPAEPLPPGLESSLLSAFRGWKKL